MTGYLHGALAGAAGTTALNAITYLDMTVRGRGSSSTPEQLVEHLADSVGVGVPGSGQTRDNRLEALGALSGIGVGVAVGAAAGLVRDVLHARGRRLPGLVGVLVLGAAAMALSDVPLKVFGISDPSTWSAKDWTSDVVPHLVYGAVTYAVLVAEDPA